MILNSAYREESMVRTVAMCDMCRRVLDDVHQTQTVNGQLWVDVHRYLSRHVLAATDVTFLSTYCCECRESYDRLMTYGGVQ
jgi:hypothetical protein